MKQGAKSILLAIISIVEAIAIVAMVTFAWIEGNNKPVIGGSHIQLTDSPNLIVALGTRVGIIEIKDAVPSGFTMNEVSSTDGLNMFVASDDYQTINGVDLRTVRAATTADNNDAYIRFTAKLTFDTSNASDTMKVFFNPYKTYVVRSNDASLDKRALGIEPGELQAYAESKGYADITDGKTAMEQYCDWFKGKTAEYLSIDESAVTNDNIDTYFDYITAQGGDVPPYTPSRYSYDASGYYVATQVASAVLNPIRTSLSFQATVGTTTTFICGMREESNSSLTYAQLMDTTTYPNATKAVSGLDVSGYTDAQLAAQSVYAALAGQDVVSFCKIGTTGNPAQYCSSLSPIFTLTANQSLEIQFTIWLEGGDVDTVDSIAATYFDIQLYLDSEVVAG